MKDKSSVVNFKIRKKVDEVEVVVDEKYFLLMEKKLKRMIKEARLAVKGMPQALSAGVCFEFYQKHRIRNNSHETAEVLDWLVCTTAREYVYCKDLNSNLSFPFGLIRGNPWSNEVPYKELLSPAEKRLALLNLMLRICKKFIELTMEEPIVVLWDELDTLYVKYENKFHRVFYGGAPSFTDKFLLDLMLRETSRRTKYREKLLALTTKK